MEDNATEYFDTWSKGYDQYLDGSPHYDILTDCLLQSMHLSPEEHVLDIGIGTGNLAFKINERFGCQFSGIDVSQEMLNITKAKAEEKGMKVDLRLEKIESTTHKENSFDAAIASFALHHVPAEKKLHTFHHIYRILKHGGRLGIAECVVDVDGDPNSVERLGHIIKRWGAAAIEALKNGGPDFAVVELDAMKDIYLRNHEYLERRETWKKLATDSGFIIETEKITNEVLGHCVLICKKKDE